MTLPYNIPPWLEEDKFNWSDHPISAPICGPKDGFNESNHPSPAPFYSPKGDRFNWSNPSSPCYSPKDESFNWSNHPSSVPFYSPKGDRFNWSNPSSPCYSPKDESFNWSNHPSSVPFYSPKGDRFNWSNPSSPCYSPKDESFNWSNHPSSVPFYSPKGDRFNWSNPSSPCYSPKDESFSWSNHPSSVPFYSPKGDHFNWSNHHSSAPLCSLTDDRFNQSDHPTSSPFYSPKYLGSTFHKFSSPSPVAPLSLVNHSDGSFFRSKVSNFDPSDDLYSQPDNLMFPLNEWKSAPILQSPGRSEMKPHQTKSFENYLTPLPPPPVMKLCFQESSPSPRGSPMIRRFSCSPLSDDSGYSGNSTSFDSEHSSFSSESPSQFTDTPKRKMQKPGMKGMKRKADEDVHVSSPCQPTMKRKKVDCLQSNGPGRTSLPALPSWMITRAYPLVASQFINPLQRDLDVIFRSIIEVLLSHSDIGSLCLTRDAIVSEMKTTSSLYSKNNLANTERRQDFSRGKTRWGYIYMYMMRHAHLVFHSLKQIHLTSNIPPPLANSKIWNISFDQGGLHTGAFLQKCQQPGGILTVCAIGGGPGSDLLGLAMFLRANKFPVKIRAHVFDKCVDWADSWQDLIQQLPPYIADYFDSVTYIQFDYLSATLSNTQAEIIRKSDLVTIVKSLSAVATKLFQTKNTNRSSNGLLEILSTVTPGCLVLYLDNKAGTPGKVFQQTLKKIPGCQYTMVYYEVSQVQLPPNGFSLASRHFMDWISYGPCFSSGTNEIVALARKWMMEF